MLVSGAGGFMGSHLIERLSNEHEVYALARSPLGTPRVQWIAHDLTLPLAHANLPSSIDAVIHLAQSRHYRAFPEQAQDIYDVNVHSTFALLEYARTAGAQRFCFASTGGVYRGGDHPVTESDPVAPSGFYPASKIAAEQLVNAYSGLMQTIVWRFFFVYGLRQSPTMLIPRLVHSIYSGSPVTLQGEEGIRINPIHISDAVEAMARSLLLDESCTINVAGAEVISLRDIANTIGQLLRRQPVFTVQSGVEPTHLIADISLMKAKLSTPRMTFAEGVLELCEALLKSQA